MVRDQGENGAGEKIWRAKWIRSEKIYKLLIRWVNNRHTLILGDISNKKINNPDDMQVTYNYAYAAGPCWAADY